MERKVIPDKAEKHLNDFINNYSKSCQPYYQGYVEGVKAAKFIIEQSLKEEMPEITLVTSGTEQQ